MTLSYREITPSLPRTGLPRSERLRLLIGNGSENSNVQAKKLLGKKRRTLGGDKNLILAGVKAIGGGQTENEVFKNEA